MKRGFFLMLIQTPIFLLGGLIPNQEDHKQKRIRESYLALKKSLATLFWFQNTHNDHYFHYFKGLTTNLQGHAQELV